MTTTIHAWTYNPTRALFGKKSDKAARLQINCENPADCDLYVNENSCILQGSCVSCKFGSKTRKAGPTQRARNFRSWLQTEKEWCDDVRAKHGLTQLTAYNRIFYANGHYYLPYAGMSEQFLLNGAPLESKWVPAEELTAEKLEELCRLNPRNIFGDRIRAYHEKEVPKFLTDLKLFYPALFAQLPQDLQERVAEINYVGRKADLTTVAPGPVTLAQKVWQWDGEMLTRKGDMLFQPVKGDCVTTITPARGSEVTIERNEQVTKETVLLD